MLPDVPLPAGVKTIVCAADLAEPVAWKVMLWPVDTLLAMDAKAGSADCTRNRSSVGPSSLAASTCVLPLLSTKTSQPAAQAALSRVHDVPFDD